MAKKHCYFLRPVTPKNIFFYLLLSQNPFLPEAILDVNF